MDRTLKEMIVVITGASAGIGRELAVQLHAAGARLILSARREEKLQELNRELGAGHLVVAADVSKQADCQRLVETAFNSLGRIDTLVCNAGYGLYKAVGNTSPIEYREMFATNVFGTMDCIHAALPRMHKQSMRDGFRGQIMLVSSFVARRSVPMLGVYSATKAAQLSLAEAMRVELRDEGIAVTSVHPVMTRTDFGSTAEARGDIKLPSSDREHFSQSVDHVARRMVAAIAHPKAEVWPSRPSRLVAGLATLMPRWVDRGMGRYFRKIQAANARSIAGG